MTRKLLTLDEASERTGISKAQYRWMRQQNRGPKFGLVAGRLRIFEDDLNRWIEQELAATATGGAA
ncbi:helix-turn-helix transcriptional regulator [Cellulomonas uda]|nr:helix-turn-helix domain-containing protein [Cellulomonas uda]NII65573.1 putative DNA-binding transcriptional regulator AlpA [Cellulomonas uda]